MLVFSVRMGIVTLTMEKTDTGKYVQRCKLVLQGWREETDAG